MTQTHNLQIFEVIPLSSDTMTLKQPSNGKKNEKWDDFFFVWLSFSVKLLHFGKNNPEFKYFMDGREFQCIVVEKDLGVFVDKDLKFARHI